MLHYLSTIFWEFFAVLVTGLLLGAGIPALYALGMRSLAWGEGAWRDSTPENPGPRHRSGKILAYLSFSCVFIIIGLGLAAIIATGLGIYPG